MPKLASTRPAYKMLTCIYLCRTLLFFAPYTNFYAKKMCVSAKHLTMVITDMSGRSAKDWIIEYSILEIKALLRDSDLEIKEVASRTNFQSNSVMTRFFREHTGMTPSEYRERIYVKNKID